jgi:hypothetical protein
MLRMDISLIVNHFTLNGGALSVYFINYYVVSDVEVNASFFMPLLGRGWKNSPFVSDRIKGCYDL